MSSDDTMIEHVSCVVAPAGLVGVDAAGTFAADGQPFVPQGINSYPLLQHVGNGQLGAVNDIFAQANSLGRTIVRTPAFMDGGTNPARIRETDLTIREEGLVALDRLLDTARAHDIRLLLTLTNNWDNFGGAPGVMHAIDPDLPKDAFWSDARALEAQASYERILVQRINSINGRSYADDPTIFAWELVNEARCDSDRFCDRDTLVRWARVMASAIRESGARQPIAWGGSGYVGSHGENLEAIANDRAVDVLTLHLYATSTLQWLGESKATAAIRTGNDAIRERAAIARKHGLPLILEEVGWRSGGDRERARVLAAWAVTAQEEGVGVFPWMIGENGRTDYDGYLIRPEDGVTIDALRCE